MEILIVDDEPGYRNALEYYLKLQGRKVYAASNGEEALKLLQEKKVDFIISDIYMPVMDGIKLQRAISAIPEIAQIPFLFISGQDDDHTMSVVKSIKNCGFMKKTKPLEELEEWIVYLTLPADKRPTQPPGIEKKITRADRYRR